MVSHEFSVCVAAVGRQPTNGRMGRDVGRHPTGFQLSIHRRVGQQGVPLGTWSFVGQGDSPVPAIRSVPQKTRSLMGRTP